MTTLHKHLVSAFAALALGAAALGAHAQDQAKPAGERHGHAMSQEQRAAFAAKRAARLHDELKITPAQESAWNAFVASMTPPPRAGRPDRAAMASLTAPQRMAKQVELQKQHTAALEQRLGAVDSFYAVLTPEQKKTFDQKTARMGRFGKDSGGRGGWQHRNGETAKS